ncbi:hypothetical protein [Nocardia sp. CNY236]|uniref:hypothetical protein n=1 Tax=Nocardia sp. CNY236 TaxID=1169152 RepID=UPI00048F3AA6|nr:hypothetical protein [Nocardia sp. CNY236]
MSTATGSDRPSPGRGAATPVHERLDSLLAELRRGPGRDPSIGDAVAAAVDAWRTPPRIQVAGRARAGRSAVLHALGLMTAQETDPVDQPQTPTPELDADIVVYVLSAAPTPADRRVLSTVPPERTIAVLNKADAIGSRWADAVAAAEHYGAQLGVSVVPLVASLAVRTRTGVVTDADLAALRTLAADSDSSLLLSPDLFIAPGPDAAEREQLLHRWDLYGVACACSALRHDPRLPAPALLQILHAASGIDPLHRLLHRLYQQIAALRGGDLLDELARLAARAVPGDGGRARDVLESFLSSDDAVWLGLLAGLAHPDVVHLTVDYPAAAPLDANDAIARAKRWRAVVTSDLPAGARRAALRAHTGYVRVWERMSGAGL